MSVLQGQNDNSYTSLISKYKSLPSCNLQGLKNAPDKTVIVSLCNTWTQHTTLYGINTASLQRELHNSIQRSRERSMNGVCNWLGLIEL